ncbi:cytochrome P450 oxidoreductase GliF [Aspergillus venezuelensis]
MFQARHRNASIPERVVVFSAVFYVFYFLWNTLVRPKPIYRLGLPVLGDSQAKNCDLMKAITNARLTVPDSPYIIENDQFPMVVFPSYMYEEIKKLPDHTASLPAYLARKFFAPYTLIGRETTALLNSIKLDMARALPVTAPKRQQDAQAAVRERIGDCPDWKEVEIFPAVLDMVATTNAAFFMGEDPAMTKQWSELSIEHVTRALMGALVVGYLPRVLQSILAPFAFLPTVITKWRIHRALAPRLRKEMKQFHETAAKKGLLTVSKDGKVPFTAALMSRYKPHEATLGRLVKDYIALAFLTNFAVAVALHLNILDFASRPELVEVVREEVRDTTSDGVLPQSHLSELRKLDSIMRESLRVNAMSLFVLNRLLRQPTQLSIGPKLPAGTAICVDMHHINRSSALWEYPEKFEPMRHHDLRQIPDCENKFQFVSVGPESPLWGDGSMVCPGRLFANSTIKVILVNLLTHYDIQFAPGHKKQAKAAVPEGSWDPDLKARLLLRSRKEGSF